MVGQFTKSTGKFFVNLLLLTLILNFFILIVGEDLEQKQAIINAADLRMNVNSSRQGQSDLNANRSTKKIKANNKLITNKKIQIQGTVEQDIKQVVVFSSNNMDVYRADVRNSTYEVNLSFSTPGTKEINIVGLDEKGEVVDSLIRKVDVYEVEKHLIHDMPYFYQYNNDYFPASTCQNTAIAMVLKYYGWQGNPDKITKTFGKMKAQYGDGFSEVFNHYARNNNLDIRIRNNVNISPRYIENQLKEGKPVVAHGKFTSYGHIIVLVGFDDEYYYANDPAGKWDQEYRGDYKQRTAENGKYVRYKKENLLRAMERRVGLWIHEVYTVDSRLANK
ncbi:C39 family peptidase [Halanaerobacter jeridensis]|uniref:Uncharacterized protein YvpB n=1 Tax=Halanaerobacter jeridensis TaxID=706427 RepID=A0A939BPG6_9FIRM|nr:C39 family peptidase [Halanaerobacter jeridensis]MBM7557032.1 uncharacterized protein YvpB [Halanaerobacter jeridensis]